MKGFRFGLRSTILLVAVFCIHAAAVSAFSPHQGKIPMPMLLSYVLFWLLPAISIGYDRNKSASGIANGLTWGAVLCVATFWLFGFKLLRSYSVYS